MEEVRRIGDYEIVRELSRSSIASVYEGHQPSLDRRVLIKRLHPECVGDPEIRARFEREARALARIKHKNIVHIYDFQVAAENAYLVAEWISGGSVAEFLKNSGPLSERETVALTVDLLEGLQVAYEAGIIHRDIKPQNLLISNSGNIKITDFGLAQFEGSPSVTMQGMVIGTPAYLAPEVVAGQLADIRCDMYAVGVTLYELMTGDNPFTAQNISETLNRVMNLKPPPLEGVSPEMQKLLNALLEKRPEKRIATPDEALKMVYPLAEKHNVERGWVDVGVTAKGKKIERNGEESPALKSTIRPKESTRGKQSLLFAAAGTLVAGIIIALLFFRPPEKTGEEAVPSIPATTETTEETTGKPAEPGESEAEPGEEEAVPGGEGLNAGTIEEEGDNSVSPGLRRPVREEEAREPPREISGETAKQVAKAEEVAGETATGETTSTAAPAGPGYLMLSVDPWANIYYKGRLVAQTPYYRPLRLPSGKVELSLVNTDLRLPPVVKTFDIPENDTLVTHLDLRTMVGRIRLIDAIPWAKVYLDGESLGETPINKDIYVPYGRHELRFVHPRLPEKTEIVDIEPDDPPKSIRVNLLQ